MRGTSITIACLAVSVLALATPRAGSAIKHDVEVELERTKMELRLRTAELTVTRGQLRSCQKHSGPPTEEDVKLSELSACVMMVDPDRLRDCAAVVKPQ